MTPVDLLYSIGIGAGLVAVIGLNLGLLVTFILERRARNG